MSHYREETKLLHARRFFIALSCLAVAAPLLALVVPCRPNQETLGAWFQRSGSLMVALSLIAELGAVRIFNILNPSGLASVGFDEFEERYKVLPSKYSLICLMEIAVGTLIGGYGNLLPL
jgi:hypothetical protein